jgi:hypothetical protein
VCVTGRAHPLLVISRAVTAQATTTAESEAPKPVELGVADDHVASLTKSRKPILAIEELIWNSLDADAKNVSVDLVYNALQGLDTIVVEDDGHGMSPEDREEVFGKIGGSLKRTNSQTLGGRSMHGKEGKGRFRAFALGPIVEWMSRYKDGGVVKQWSIRGDSMNLKRFPNTSPKLADSGKTGTTVTVSNVTVSPDTITSEPAWNDLLIDLAPYLRKYPAVKVVLDGKVLDVSTVVENEVDHPLSIEVAGVTISAQLKIIEWSMDVERRIILCNADGVGRREEQAGIQAKGYDNFTAYVRSDLIGRMSEAELAMADLDPRLRALIEAAKEKLREHFKARESDRLRAVVEEWKSEGSYPYEGEPSTPLGRAERDVFDILAINVHQRLTGFSEATSEGKSFTFKLLRQALETNPSSLQLILKEVLKLPKQEQDDFAALLQRATLSGIIRAAKVVADRLKFIDGFKGLLFGQETKELLKERSQLQKILLRELWIFGDKYLLGLDDQSLKALLAAHMNILEREILAEELQVKDIKGAQSIPDLMLYRRYADREQGHFEHLVVELKRPSVKAGQTEINQIEKYAFTVQKDPRFDKVKTRWTFLLVVNDLDEIAEAKAQPQPGRQYGHLFQGENLNIFVKKWSGIIQECEWRHEFYRRELELELQDADGREYVEKKHAQFLPPTDAAPAKGGRKRAASKKS